MGTVIYLCESCERHAAKRIVHFDADAELPAADYKICPRCAIGLEAQSIAL